MNDGFKAFINGKKLIICYIGCHIASIKAASLKLVYILKYIYEFKL